MLPIQAILDSNYRFLCFSARCVGSTHDAMAQAVSSFGTYWAQGILQAEFWIAGDETYVSDEAFITLYPRSQSGLLENNLNILSSLRAHVEQAFGLFSDRWRMLRNGMDFWLNIHSRIVCLCMKVAE